MLIHASEDKLMPPLDLPELVIATLKRLIRPERSRPILAVAWLALSVCTPMLGQLPSPVTDSEPYATTGTGTSKFIGYGIAFHLLNWSTGGSGCLVQLEGSNDNVTFATMFPAAQNCSSSGSATVTAAFRYARVHVTALPSGPVTVAYSGTIVNASNPNFGVAGMPVVQGFLSQYQVSTSAIYVSVVNGGNLGTDACAAINYALANSFFQGQTVVVDLQGDQPCKSNPFAQVSGNNVCTGDVIIGAGANYHLQGSSSWVIPTHCHVIFSNQAKMDGVEAGSIVSACLMGDVTCGGVPFTSGIALACFGPAGLCVDSGPNPSIQFDSVIIGGTFDCRFQNLCIGIQNNDAQENSGVFGSAIIGWGHGGIGLDIGCNNTSGVCGTSGTTATTSAANSTYEHLQINNQVVPAGSSCLTGAVGIRVNSGFTSLTSPPNTSLPRKLSDVTVDNGGCPIVSRPHEGIQIGGGDGILLSAIHVETMANAAVDIGQVTINIGGSPSALPTTAVTIEELSCATLGSGSCVVISNSSPVPNNVVIHNISVSGAANVINDLNNTMIPTTSGFGAVSQYVTDLNGNVLSDSSYTNPPVLGTPNVIHGSQVFYSNSYSYKTTLEPASTPTPTAPVVVNLPSASGTLATTLDTVGNPAASKVFALGNMNFLTFGDSTSTATGSGINLVTMTDGPLNSGTGAVLNVQTGSGSNAIPLSIGSTLTGSLKQPAVSITPTWNGTAAVDAALFINASGTDTANSLLIDAQFGSTSEWKADKSGNVTQAGNLNLASASLVELGADTTISRAGQSVLEIGPGGGGSTGFVKTAQSLTLTSDFSTTSTSLAQIPGLTITLPSFATNWGFNCDLVITQITGTAGDQIGVQTPTNAPTSMAAGGFVGSVGTGAVSGSLGTSTQSLATFTSAGGTRYAAHIGGGLAGASASGTVFQIVVSTGNSSHTIIVSAGSSCWFY
jgi:hypothetical protein